MHKTRAGNTWHIHPASSLQKNTRPNQTQQSTKRKKKLKTNILFYFKNQINKESEK